MKKNSKTHKHHVIPRHAGGTNNADNIVELTVEEHADAHHKLYEKYGRWQDKLAWKALSGQIGKEEIIRERQRNSGGYRGPEATKKAIETKRQKGILHKPTWNAGLTKETDIRLQESSDRNKHNRMLGILSNIGDIVRGKKFRDSHKKKLSLRAKNRQKIKCEHCNKEFTPAMFSRWHGDDCKLKDGKK